MPDILMKPRNIYALTIILLLLNFLYDHFVLFYFLKRYRTPSRSRSRDRFRRSETPPHWRQEMQRAQRMRVSSGERWIKGDK
jgi:hypothetical protein